MYIWRMSGSSIYSKYIWTITNTKFTVFMRHFLIKNIPTNKWKENERNRISILSNPQWIDGYRCWPLTFADIIMSETQASCAYLWKSITPPLVLPKVLNMKQISFLNANANLQKAQGQKLLNCTISIQSAKSRLWETK